MRAESVDLLRRTLDLRLEMANKACGLGRQKAQDRLRHHVPSTDAKLPWIVVGEVVWNFAVEVPGRHELLLGPKLVQVFWRRPRPAHSVRDVPQHAELKAGGGSRPRRHATAHRIQNCGGGQVIQPNDCLDLQPMPSFSVAPAPQRVARCPRGTLTIWKDGEGERVSVLPLSARPPRGLGGHGGGPGGGAARPRPGPHWREDHASARAASSPPFFCFFFGSLPLPPPLSPLSRWASRSLACSSR